MPASYLIYGGATRQFYLEITLRNGDKVPPDNAIWRISNTFSFFHSADVSQSLGFFLTTDFVSATNRPGKECTLSATATIVKNSRRYTFRRAATLYIIANPVVAVTDPVGVVITAAPPR